MTLALFDLDHTLLDGDSDYLWGQFLVEQGIVDGDDYEQRIQEFFDQYQAGTMDIHAFLSFQLAPLAEHPVERLEAWRARFITERIAPIILPAAHRLIAQHRSEGRTPVIITATNSFITAPIAERLGVPHLLATEPEMVDGRYTGRPAGIPCYRDGKVKRLEAWLEKHGESLTGSWFYSDSHNDLPLLERVDHPVAVDPDDRLRREAARRGWDVISLKS